jgi:diguanylate cyclase (GGDEF)-like protein
VENDLSAASQIAERLKNAIRGMPFSTSRGDLPVSVSIGVTAFMHEKADLSALIEKVGQALHLAKQEGCNKIFIL